MHLLQTSQIVEKIEIYNKRDYVRNFSTNMDSYTC